MKLCRMVEGSLLLLASMSWLACAEMLEGRGGMIEDVGNINDPEDPLGSGEWDEPTVKGTQAFNFVVGTQSIGASYQFTSEPKLVETARVILKMGSTLIKTNVGDPSAKDLQTILQMPFQTYFFWFRNSGWQDGMNEAKKKQEYSAVFQFARKLLTEHDGSGKTFFLGHWEGDWLLLKDYNASKDAEPGRIQAMIDWLNVRQAAIDDARQQVPHKNVQIYHYVEVNRVRDAMDKGQRRVVNSVLPRTSVDYVSYSAYDSQQADPATVHKTLNYIQDKLPAKEGLPGRRVFVGEYGLSAQAVSFDPQAHEKKNREIAMKFLSWGCPFVLYWEVYNNEVKNGQQVGFWLIDDQGEIQPLYHTFQRLYRQGKVFVANYLKAQGRQPSSSEYAKFASRELGNQSTPSPEGPCTDVPPDDRYSCAQQAGWGKCDESWMKGLCNRSCDRCQTGDGTECIDVPPDDRYSCDQQAAWGKCQESWMRGFCVASCGLCMPNGNSGCSDIPPDDGYTCAQQAGWGQCDESWMQGFCHRSCNRC